jgi:hypothetical protein
MMNIESDTLIVGDAAGDYFLVPRAVLEQGRVPEERRAEIERLLADADTAGYFIGVFGAMYRALASTAQPPASGSGKVTFSDILVTQYSDVSSNPL